MSELGCLLEEARIAKELSLADVEAATRVRQKYLEALEQGNYAALPPGAIARGFLRNYARFLDLDPADALMLYTRESGDPGVISMNGHRAARPVDYRPLEVELMREDRGNGAWRWVAALVIVAAVAAASWWVLNNTAWARTITLPGLLSAFAPQPGPQAAAAAGPRVTPAATVATRTATPTRPAVTVTPPAEPTGLAASLPTAALASVAARPGDTQPTPTSDLLTLPIPTVQPSPTPIPTPTFTPTPETVPGISLTLKISQRAWVKVTADGNLVLPGELLEAGQERGWQASSQITILTGNAGGTGLILNGQELGAMGNVGQVVERTWVVDQDKISEVAPNRPTATPGQ